MFGRLSDVVNQERMSYANQGQEVQSGNSADYTASMERYLKSLRKDPIIDSRGLEEGFLSFRSDEEHMFQHDQRVGSMDQTQDSELGRQSLSENSRGQGSAPTKVRDVIHSFQTEGNILTSDLQSESLYAKEIVNQDEQRFEDEVRRGGRLLETICKILVVDW